jgi:hypothetical protein
MAKRPRLASEGTVWQSLVDLETSAVVESGGREGIRTLGLLVANEALSQLSYSPTSSKSILAKALVLANTRSRVCKQKGRSICPGPAGMLRPDPKRLQYSSRPYGWSRDPPARWATIFLAF